MTEKGLEEKKVILFDGVCNLCNGFVNFLIDRDTKGVLRYASLQSDFGQDVLKHFDMPPDNLDTVVFIENGKFYTRSTAALRICRYLPKYSFLYGFILVPRFIRDGVYKLISRYRYSWFGKEEACRMPTPELKARFLG